MICDYFDKYSCLHIASGITAYIWGLSLPKWIVVHLAYSFFENSKMGINFTRDYLAFFKTYKEKGDSMENLIGDTICAIIGWLIVYTTDCVTLKYRKIEGRGKLQDETYKCKLREILKV